MMVRSCVLAMVIATMAGTAHLCGEPVTTGTLAPSSEEVAEQARREEERLQRIRRHTERIRSAVELRRQDRFRLEQDHRSEASGTENPFAEEQDESKGLVDDHAPHRTRDDAQYVIRMASGLGKAEANRLKAQLAEDVSPDLILIEPAGGRTGRHRTRTIMNGSSGTIMGEAENEPGDSSGNVERDLSVAVGPFQNQARALSVYRMLVERGYRFDTLPGWGRVVEKRERDARERSTETVRPEKPEPVISRVPQMPPRPIVRVQGASRAVGRRVLPEFYTSGTAEALAGGQTPPSLDDLLASRGVDSDRKVHLAFSEAPMERVLESLTRQTGIPLVARGPVAREPVSIIIRDAEPAKAIGLVLAGLPQGGIFHAPSLEEGTAELWDVETFRSHILPGLTKHRLIEIREIDLGDAQRVVAGMLTRDLGSVVPVANSRELVVTDLPWVLKDVEDLLVQIDRRPGPAAPPGRETAY